MILGVQYYRPPFPNQTYWDDDFRAIRDSGLNAVQLWVLWSWVEATPGTYEFGDYDRLMELAARHGLNVVLSAISEVQPYWIHREVPGSEMITRSGHKVVSSNRNEVHFGITPGGCFDHPEVWARTCAFIGAVVERYRGAEHLAGWDCWNELRWNVQADDLVCYCPHTLKSYRAWLDKRYGGLEGLNREWLRRYGAWDEVVPGKVPSRPYTDMMAFQYFLTGRSNDHGAARYRIIKELDPSRPVTLHAGEPSPYLAGGAAWGQWALDRGNDWAFADSIDGVGTSSFPNWGRNDQTEYTVRISFTRSAARGKQIWLSELQGGRAASGFDSHKPVRAREQQQWVWNGVGIHADSVIFWCWRDEVFGQESAGFGLSGDDGFADERLAAMRKTSEVLQAHKALFDGYREAAPEVGVLFSPQSYYLCYAQDGTAERARSALLGYCRALVRAGVPYQVVEEEHLEDLDALKVLFLPRVLVTTSALEEALERFVKNGGTLVCESECGAFDTRGIYRYPAERLTARLSGAVEVGRRALSAEQFEVDLWSTRVKLGAAQWCTPWRGVGEVLAEHDDGAMAGVCAVGKGAVILLASYLGEAYYRARSDGFERMVRIVAKRAGWRPKVTAVPADGPSDEPVICREGRSAAYPVLFLLAPEGVERVRVTLHDSAAWQGRITELLSGTAIDTERTGDSLCCCVDTGAWGVAVLAALT